MKNAHIWILLGIGAVAAALPFDAAFVNFFSTHQGNFWYIYFNIVTQAGQSEWYLVPTGVVAIVSYIILKRNHFHAYHDFIGQVGRRCAFVFASVAVSGIVVNILKIIFGRARPKMFDQYGAYHFNWFTIDSHFNSFPSGHSNTAFALAVSLGFLFPRYRWLFIAAAAAIAFSRVIVNMHYFSDTVAGSLLAVLTTVMLYDFFKKKNWLN